MNMSFQEKSIWISLVSTLLVMGAYFIRAFHVFTHPEVSSQQLFIFFIAATVILIILQIILQSIVAALHHKDANNIDERDNAIKLKSTRISYFVLMAGVWMSAASFVFQASVLFTLNIIMFTFFLAELVGFAMQLFYYKKGV